jgi:hypothetical protein
MFQIQFQLKYGRRSLDFLESDVSKVFIEDFIKIAL